MSILGELFYYIGIDTPSKMTKNWVTQKKLAFVEWGKNREFEKTRAPRSLLAAFFPDRILGIEKH